MIMMIIRHDDGRQRGNERNGGNEGGGRACSGWREFSREKNERVNTSKTQTKKGRKEGSLLSLSLSLWRTALSTPSSNMDAANATQRQQ